MAKEAINLIKYIDLLTIGSNNFWVKTIVSVEQNFSYCDISLFLF